MERWQRHATRNGDAPSDDVPLALVREGPHGQVIHATNRAARLSGVTAEARVVDMRAVCPALRVEYADPAGDAQGLERLALWARRWCPWSVRDGVDGLVLETTGSDHLMGGEAAMLTEMESRLSLLGLTTRLAVAPTWGAAWALARFGPVRAICHEADLVMQLAPLPVAALRLEADTLLLLQRLGLKTIGQLAQVPRLSLARRFVRSPLEANPLMRLDQAMGRLAEPVASVAADPPILARAGLPEPIQDPTAYLPQLCQDLCARMDRAGVGCRRLHLTVYRTDGEVSRLDVATAAASRDAAHLCKLFEGRLARLNPGFGFDLITLEADRVEEIAPRQPGLDGRADAGVPLPQLMDRLVARLGARAVKHPALRESHLPERAQFLAPVPVAASAEQAVQPRPLRLFEPPEEIRVLYAVPEGPPAQFVWRRQTHRVVRYAGPERIAPEWWHDRPGTRLRDYFRVEDQTGGRYWLYREGLHEDGRGGDPRWFVHGGFA